jgi:putative PIN family toxin of toxin-antitoxin system
MKIVLDTNVIVSALLSPQGVPAKILNLVLNGSVIIVYDNNVVAEYMDVLSRPRLKINQELKNLIIDFIDKEGEYTIAEPKNIKFEDEDDKKFYELYKNEDNSYLITGNKKHFPKEKGIVTPKEFIENEYNTT